MTRLTFSTRIHAPAIKVYESMLGLKDKSTYRSWTSAFNSSSDFEGNWEKGSKILFVGLDEHGKKGGMVSEVTEHIPGKLVCVRHYGYLDGDKEVTEGEEVEKWAGGYEIYKFEENNGTTNLIVELDSIDEYLEYFRNTYPTALEKLKAICESGN